MFDPAKIDATWTLFLDRDGVINHEAEITRYVLNADAFRFYEGVGEAMKIFNRVFKFIFVTTNQRGVGRNLMTENDLANIHQVMMHQVETAGGRIDKIYYCTAVADDDPCRKPNPGMIFKAMEEFDDIQPDRSIIVGNNISDMQFGRNAGIHTVLLTTTGTRITSPHPLVDGQYNSLIDFARELPVT